MAKKFGLLAKFDTPADIMHAAEKVRDEGFKQWDVITPFPIHGMDPAMGLKRSIIPRFTIIGGTFGFTAGMLMIFFTNAVDYKILIGGKPLFSPLAAFPVAYEMTIFCAAFISIIGMFIVNGLPRHNHPVLAYDDIKEGSDDKFFLYIEKDDPQFDDVKTRSLLESLHPVKIDELDD
tara:strand:- start:417 stop:947 length:531 start_codon:yes stop_codon:yes gene_type:complete